MANHSQVLDWDSTFFRKKICSINIDNYDERYIIENLNFYKKEKFDLVYLFNHSETQLSSSVISENICRLVDTKVVYNLDIFSDNQLDNCINVEVFRGMPNELYNLGIQAGYESRYKIDENFSDSDFKHLYETWIDKSCSGFLADKVLVCKDNNVIEGFITLKKKENTMSIILIATDKNYRGRGIGQTLFSYAKKYSKDNNCIKLDVATQEHNKLACHFYEKNGMTISSKTDIYHVWLRDYIVK